MLKEVKRKVKVLKESLDSILKEYKERNITNLKALEKFNWATDDFELQLVKIAETYNIDNFERKHTI